MLMSKKAFTIVELVIVIAVIAILAAVMIPTFSSIVQKASLSVDSQTVALINKSISVYLVDSDITSESDLEKAVDSALGIGKYETLSPKSASQGYHFWYDYAAQQVVLSRYAELDGIRNVATNRQLITLSGENVIPTPENGFEDDSVRSYLKSGYYFMDQKGSALAEIVEAIYSVQSQNDYLSLFAKAESISKDDADQAIADAVIDFVDSTVFITEEGSILKVDAHAIVPEPKKHIIISPQIVHIKNIVIEIDDSLNGEVRENITIYVDIENAITLPDTVEKIDTGALNFGSDDVIIETSMTEEKMVECFGASSTNATITSVSGTKYTIEGNALKNESGEQVGKDLVGEAAVLLSYELNVTDVANKVYFDEENDTVYIAYDYSGDIYIKGADFSFDGTPQSGDDRLEWTLSGSTDLMSVTSNASGATLTVSDDPGPKMTPDALTLKATSFNSSVERSLNILFVYPVEYELSANVDGSPASFDENKCLLVRMSSLNTQETELMLEINNITYVNPCPEIVCDTPVVITLADNTVFVADGVRLSVADDVPDNHGETVTVTFANIVKSFTVVFEVSNESPFYFDESNNGIEINEDMLVLSDYFILKDGVSLPEDQVITVSFYMKNSNTGKYFERYASDIIWSDWYSTKQNLSIYNYSTCKLVVQVGATNPVEFEFETNF